jgi:hypothetical protein
MCTTADEIYTIFATLAPPDQKRMLTVALILAERQSGLRRKALAAIRVRDYSTLDKVLDELLAEGKQHQP